MKRKERKQKKSGSKKSSPTERIEKCDNHDHFEIKLIKKESKTFKGDRIQDNVHKILTQPVDFDATFCVRPRSVREQTKYY